MGMFDNLATKANQSVDTLQSIYYKDIIKNSKNFYSLDDIEDLAENIKEIGLLEPLRVKKCEDGKYILVSGHRRLSAIMHLISEGNHDFEYVNCIVSAKEASTNFISEDVKIVMLEKLGEEKSKELILQMNNTHEIITANTKRDKTDDDIKNEIKTIEKEYDLFKTYGAKNLGLKRDYVGAKLNLSGRQIANIKKDDKETKEFDKTTGSANEIVEKVDKEEKKKMYATNFMKKLDSFDKLLSEFDDNEFNEYATFDQQQRYKSKMAIIKSVIEQISN